MVSVMTYRKFQTMLPLDGPIDFVFDSRVWFSGMADGMQQLLVAPNSRWLGNF